MGKPVIVSARAFMPGTPGDDHCGVIVTKRSSQNQLRSITHLMELDFIFYRVAFEGIVWDGTRRIAVFRLVWSGAEPGPEVAREMCKPSPA
jgi:hypothetical protein